MTATTTAAPADPPALTAHPEEGASPIRKGFKPPPWLRRLGGWFVNAYAGFVIFYLLLPVAVIVAFSFNNPVGKFNFVW